MKPPDACYLTLSDRQRRAREASAALVDDASVLVEASTSIRTDSLIRRCAWCDRYHVGGRWRRASETTVVLTRVGSNGLTHTICEDCTNRLQVSGKSR